MFGSRCCQTEFECSVLLKTDNRYPKDAPTIKKTRITGLLLAKGDPEQRGVIK